MNVVLTICSANYLAHAKVLGDSLAQSNPGCKFVIGLVDRIPKEVETDGRPPYEVIPVADLGIPQFAGMEQKYDVVELNTAVKPFYMEFIYNRDIAVEAVIYLDPDIFVFGSLNALFDELHSKNIIVTPHSCTYDDSKDNIHYEIGMLGTGIYNLGFIATARGKVTLAFLKWWQKRLVDYCYYLRFGIFVDQLWTTLAPLYFDGVLVLKDPGYNMSYWNHFERELSRQENRYIVNGRHELVFYHFSSYNPLKPDAIASRSENPIMTFAERPDLKDLYDDYSKRLLDAGYASIRQLKCSFGRESSSNSKRTVKSRAKVVLKGALCAMPEVIQRQLKRGSRFITENCGI